jgi:hypothetical protein
LFTLDSWLDWMLAVSLRRSDPARSTMLSRLVLCF